MDSQTQTNETGAKSSKPIGKTLAVIASLALLSVVTVVVLNFFIPLQALAEWQKAGPIGRIVFVATGGAAMFIICFIMYSYSYIKLVKVLACTLFVILGITSLAPFVQKNGLYAHLHEDKLIDQIESLVIENKNLSNILAV